MIIHPGKHTKLKSFPVPIKSVKITGFFSRYLENNRKISIPLLYRLFEKYGTIDNFRVAAGLKKGEITRRLATDSDLYKWMEAVSWDLHSDYNESRATLLENLIKLISRTQESSGYIDTFYTGSFKKLRFTDLDNGHELYCGGHLIQSAIAHYRTTGKSHFLDIAIKWANFILKKYEAKQILKNDGHPEVEMALVELYRTTGNEKYLYLAEQMLTMPYVHLGNKNFLQMKEVNGHAVRMMYLCCGASDYYGESGDIKYFKKLKLLYDDLCAGKYYITGGIGSRYQGESFGLKYELPNLRAYCETCASIALMMWLYRMFLLEPESHYFDLFETALYNSFLASVSLNGKKYFYVNPLSSTGTHQRQFWYRTTCCPPNFQRFMASLPGYFYAVNNNSIWVNLYDENQAIIELPSGDKISLDIKTKYPWNGNVFINTSSPKRPIYLYLRIPSWSHKTIVNDGRVTIFSKSGCYHRLKIIGSTMIQLKFDISSKFYVSHPSVESNRSCIAIKRGPIVYCFEDIDNKFNIFDFSVPQQNLIEKFEEILGGIFALYGNGYAGENRLPLYQVCQDCSQKQFFYKNVRFKMIPYFAWANRRQSKMIIWVPYTREHKDE
ncbi:MAG TPA: glycoside hydrolase family 127 protein [bacterium]|nr:glycoside hydrolase family 127 protein [bacterium]HOL35322.1 glycoside hydrolase family 127 protein [bacterium]HPP09153.1 glycoside hydrolase family 127 protein [bacterium]